MKILVIGGTRYFGKRLVHLLINEGHEIWVLSRGQAEDDFGARVHRLKADRTDQAAMQKAIGNLNFDVVVDQVCMNAEQARIAVEVLNERTPFYIMTSTLSVYPWGSDLTEDEVNPYLYVAQTPTNPVEEYAEGKRAAENYFATHAAFVWAFARYPFVLGEDDYTLRLHQQVQRIKEGKPIYYPNLNAKLSLIDSEDAAKSLLWIIHGKHQGIYNFASEKPIVMREFVQEIESVTGKKAQLLNTLSQEDWSPYGIKADFCVSVEKAKQAGFQAKPIENWFVPLLKKINHTDGNKSST